MPLGKDPGIEALRERIKQLPQSDTGEVVDPYAGQKENQDIRGAITKDENEFDPEDTSQADVSAMMIPASLRTPVDPTQVNAAVTPTTPAPEPAKPTKQPTVIDEMRQAGFSEAEIGEWVNGQRADMRAAGFTDQEIDRDLTGLKNPRQVPLSFMQRFGEAFMGQAELSPQEKAIAEGFAAGFGDQPLGPPAADIETLRKSAIGLSVRDEAIIKSVYTGVQVAFRGLNGALSSVGALAGEIMAGPGATETEAAAARREMAQFTNIAAILLGAYAGRPGYGAYPGEVHTVGPLPRAQDFTDATKVVTGGDVKVEVRDTIATLYEDHGIHPAEVANDAQIHPDVAQSIANGQLPERYVPKVPEPIEPPVERPAVEPEILPPEGKEAPPEKPPPEDTISPDGIDTKHYLPATTGRELTERMAGSGGEDGGGPPPGGLGAPSIPPERRPPFFTYDDRPGWQKAYQGVLDGWRNTFQPELVSDAALRADPLFARYKSRQGAGHDRALNAADEYRGFWRTVPEADRLQYMYDFERGNFIIEVEQKPDFFQRVVGRGKEAYQQIAQRHTDLLQAAYKMEEEAGSKAGYIQDYFPHIWEKPEQARAYVEGKTAQLGPTWFQKSRTFDLIKDGIEAGLRLKTTNPEDLIAMRLMSSADMVERMGLLRNLEDMNLAVKAKGSDPNLPREGWHTINGPNREQWLIAPDIQPLWKNAVEAKGLWANEGAPGTVFRAWMALKNVWVPIKLALSAFHPLHVLHINFNEGLARAWDQVVKGADPVAALKSVADAIVSPIAAAPGFSAGAAIGGAVGGIPGAIGGGIAGGLTQLALRKAAGIEAPKTAGMQARVAWLKPEAERTPIEKAAVSLMHDGGFVPQLSEQLRINGKRALQNAVANSQWLRTIPLAMRRAIEVMQAPVFQEWIPNLKASAYLKDAQALLDRRPELIDNHEQRRIALRTIAKSIDNRYGEMNYGGLFWNRTVKDTGIGSFLSLGWQLGFVRDAVGGVLGPVARTVRALDHKETVSEATIRTSQNKITYWTAYAASAMGINAAMNYLFTGEGPHDILDYFLPRIGGTNPDGSPRRVTNMFYTREIPMAIKHVQEQGGGVTGTIKGLGDMLWAKTMFQPIKEMMENRSYYGSDIWDVNGPVYQQAGQAIVHLFGEQFNPMSVSGAIRSQQTGGQPWEMGLAALGFGPAPSYASKTGIQNRIAFLFQRHVAPLTKPAEMGEQAKERQTIRTDVLMAQRAGDQPKLREAVDRWFDAGGSNQGLSNIINKLGGDVTMFRALPEPDQRALMENATPEEKARYGPWQKSNITNATTELMVQAQKARTSGDVQKADELERRMTAGVLQAIKDGHITDRAAFDRGVKQRMLMHYQPELGAVLNLPKTMRATGPPGQPQVPPAAPAAPGPQSGAGGILDFLGGAAKAAAKGVAGALPPAPPEVITMPTGGGRRG